MPVRHLWPLILLLSTCWEGATCVAVAETPTDYRFSPGDIIQVTVTPQKDFDRMITVQPDGKISYPLVGQIMAAGLTVEQLAEQVRSGLSQELRDPQVIVSLKEMSKDAVRRVSVYGAVRTPGVVDIKDGTTLAEVLAFSGGPTRLADMRRVTITRADHSVATVDLTQTQKTGHLERDMVLQPGDFIVIPEGPSPTVLVMGEVVKPGSYELQGETRLLDVITQAGGPTPMGDLRQVKLTRLGQSDSRIIDLEPFIQNTAEQDISLNPPLQPGDAILIAPTAQRVYVMGQVARPDVYQIKPNARLLDALLLAGGPAGDGDLGRVVLVRQEGDQPPKARQFDVRKIMQSGKMIENELLRPGDIFYVPSKKVKRSLGEYASLIFSISGLASLWRYY